MAIPKHIFGTQLKHTFCNSNIMQLVSSVTIELKKNTVSLT